MLRFAVRRFYFSIVGLLLLTLPLFALLRWAALHRPPPCIATRCPAEDHWVTRIIRHDGPLYLLWQGGPPYDYWPLGLALVAAVGGFEAVSIFRARHRVS